MSVMRDFWNNVVGTAGAAAQAVGDAASSAVDAASSAVQTSEYTASSVAGTVAGAASSVVDTVEGTAAATTVASDAMGAINTVADFDKGVVEGVVGGVEGLAKGVVSLGEGVAKEGYALATDENAREQALDTAEHGLEAVGSFEATMITDPGKAMSKVGVAVESGAATVGHMAENVYDQYQQAAASGHGAEFIGKGVGQGAVLVAGAVLTDGASLGAEAGAAGAEGAALLAEGAEGAAALSESAAMAGEAGALASEGAAAATEAGAATGELATAADEAGTAATAAEEGLATGEDGAAAADEVVGGPASPGAAVADETTLAEAESTSAAADSSETGLAETDEEAAESSTGEPAESAAVDDYNPRQGQRQGIARDRAAAREEAIADRAEQARSLPSTFEGMEDLDRLEDISGPEAREHLAETGEVPEDVRLENHHPERVADAPERAREGGRLLDPAAHRRGLHQGNTFVPTEPGAPIEPPEGGYTEIETDKSVRGRSSSQMTQEELDAETFKDWQREQAEEPPPEEPPDE